MKFHHEIFLVAELKNLQFIKKIYVNAETFFFRPIQRKKVCSRQEKGDEMRLKNNFKNILPRGIESKWDVFLPGGSSEFFKEGSSKLQIFLDNNLQKLLKKLKLLLLLHIQFFIFFNHILCEKYIFGGVLPILGRFCHALVYTCVLGIYHTIYMYIWSQNVRSEFTLT